MRGWSLLLAVGVLTAGALAIRLPRLGARPMHGDEAVQAEKAATLAGLIKDAEPFRYDPNEYHGPTLYWLTLPSLRISGAQSFADTRETDYRIVPVLFGVGLVAMVLLTADGLGGWATLLAGVFMAISPAMVFYSRYYVQETLLVFFSFAAIACGWRWLRGGATAWAVLCGVSVGLAQATKETAILVAAAIAAGLVLTAAWTKWRNRPTGENHARSVLNAGSCPFSTQRWVTAGLAMAVSACLVSIALFSSFGADWQGPKHSILAYSTYLHRGSGNGIHTHPWYFYLQLLAAFRPARGFFWTEGLIVGLAAIGGVWSLLRREAGATLLPRFLTFYGLVLLAIYCAIPYKTPWCVLGVLQPMTLLAGLGAWTILGWLPRVWWKVGVGILLLGGVAHLGWECHWLNFRLPADQRNPWVYAHTSPGITSFALQMERLAAASPQGYEMAIHVVTPENYWPLPWYLRRFNPNHVGYWQDATQWQQDSAAAAPPSVILLTPDVQPAVDAALQAGYNKQMIVGLRPGVFFPVYVRDDLWQAFLKAASR